MTAARRREELAASLADVGARVIEAPAIRGVPLDDDRPVLEATRQCLSGLDLVVVTTSTGFRGWLEAAEHAGVVDRLRDRLAEVPLLARGPKSVEAIRSAGLTEFWSPPSGRSRELLDRLLADGVAGQRIAVQLPGEPMPGFVATLRNAGALVVEVPVYRWALPVDTEPLHRLVELIKLRYVDAVTFTSAPAVGGLVKVAGDDLPDIVGALRQDVLSVCVGPSCAEPLERLGIPVELPGTYRISGLIQALIERLPARRARVVEAAGHTLEIRGHAVVVDGQARALAPVPMTLLRVLSEKPGRVVSRAALLEALPRGSDGHAVEMAIARLRYGLGDSRIIRTVIKRGYRLAVGMENRI